MLVLVLVGNTLAQEHVSSILLNYQHAAQGTAFALVSVRIVAGAARGFGGIGGRILLLTPIVYLGTISYGIYLYHFFAIGAFRRRSVGLASSTPTSPCTSSCSSLRRSQ